MIDYELYCQIKDLPRQAPPDGRPDRPRTAPGRPHRRPLAGRGQVPSAAGHPRGPASWTRSRGRSSAGCRPIPTPPRRSSCACARAATRGGITIVKEYVHQIRPPRTPAFLTLSFAPGECAQVDWGQFGSINVGNTRRRLSFFVMVLCYSRMLYVEFTVSETMEHFLACHANAFAFFGGGPAQAAWWTTSSRAVLQRVVGEAARLQPALQGLRRSLRLHHRPLRRRPGARKRPRGERRRLRQKELPGRPGTDRLRPGQPGRPPVAGHRGQRPHPRQHQTPAGRAVRGREAPPQAPALAALRCGRHPPGSGQQPVPRHGGHQHLLGARRIRRGRPDAQALPRSPVPLPPGQAHRPPRPLLRPPPGLRGPRPSAGPAAAAPPGQRSEAAACGC